VATNKIDIPARSPSLQTAGAWGKAEFPTPLEGTHKPEEPNKGVMAKRTFSDVLER
jgi:hypothetical protein